MFFKNPTAFVAVVIRYMCCIGDAKKKGGLCVQMRQRQMGEHVGEFVCIAKLGPYCLIQ